jgi:hypothetical protein
LFKFFLRWLIVHQAFAYNANHQLMPLYMWINRFGYVLIELHWHTMYHPKPSNDPHPGRWRLQRDGRFIYIHYRWPATLPAAYHHVGGRILLIPREQVDRYRHDLKRMAARNHMARAEGAFELDSWWKLVQPRGYRPLKPGVDQPNVAQASKNSWTRKSK